MRCGGGPVVSAALPAVPSTQNTAAIVVTRPAPLSLSLRLSTAVPVRRGAETSVGLTKAGPSLSTRKNYIFAPSPVKLIIFGTPNN